MLVLDDVYVSPEVLQYLEETQEPVFDNEPARRFVQAGRKLAVASYDRGSSERIVALSEACFEEVKAVCGEDTAQGIAVCKDKAACRRMLAPLYPDYVFCEYTLDELDGVDPASVAYPVVLKPSTGFFSLGIYPVFNEEEWCAAIKDVHANSGEWGKMYGEAVVNDASFLVESYIEGDEYAVDAYFDNEGNAVVLNILKHDFAGSDDVSDRMYFTSKAIIEEQLEPMTSFLADCNALFGMKNFPIHVEVRIDAQNKIVPIEFNALRFAGMCCTDIAYFAWGFRTHDYFLNDIKPNWNKILEGKDGLTYFMILLSYDGLSLPSAYTFDYEAVCNRFSKVLTLRKMDAKERNTFGIMFTEAAEGTAEKEADFILHSTLKEFIL